MKRYCDWDKNVKKELKKLTYAGGFMRRYMKSIPKSETFVIFDRNKIIGWLLLAELPIGNHACVFVNLEYRGRGFGTKLIDCAMKTFPDKRFVVARWDSVSKKFFSGLRERHGKRRIKILDWWNNYGNFMAALKKKNRTVFKQTI